MSPGRPSDPRPARLAPRRRASGIPAALALALLGGCVEPPSYELSWRFAGRDPANTADEPPSNALWQPKSDSQCTQIGVGAVRVRVFPRGALICDPLAAIETTEYNCVPPGGLPVAGLALEPGEYTLAIHGLRRTGEPWACPADVLDVERDEDGEPTSDANGDPIPACLDVTVDPDADPDAETDPCVAREIIHIVIDEQGQIFSATTADGRDALAEGSIRLSIELTAPPECDDGIDNDRDGDVDGKDPACLLDDPEGESTDLGVTFFSAKVGFLDSSVVLPANVGVTALVFDFEAPSTNSDDFVVREVVDYAQWDLSGWKFAVPVFVRNYDSGTYMATVYAARQYREPSKCLTCDELSYECEDCHECDGAEDLEKCVSNKKRPEHETYDPDFQCTLYEGCQACTSCSVITELLTEPKVETFNTHADEITFETWELDFLGDDFLTPIEAPIRVLANLNLASGEPGGAQCTFGSEHTKVQKTIDELRFRVTNTQSDQPLSAAELGLNVMAVDQNGWVSFACPGHEVASQDLVWGSYSIEIQARIAGETCFEASGPLGPRPDNAQNFYLDRPEGPIPAACAECTSDSDCYGATCEAGLCVASN